MTPKERPTPILAADVFQRLRDHYRVTVLSTIEGLRTLAGELATSPPSSETSSALLATIHGRLHQLRGSAGSHGLAEASRLAGESEARVARWMTDPTLEADERAAAILALAYALEAAVMQ